MTTIFSITHPEEVTDLRVLQISPDVYEVVFSDVTGVASTSQIALHGQNTESDQMQTDESTASDAPTLLSTLEISRDHLPLHVIALAHQQDLTLCALGGLGRYIQLLLRCSTVSPQYYPLISVPVPQPVNAIQLVSDEVKVQGQEQQWTVQIYFAGQDKNIYKYTVSIRKNDQTGLVDAVVTNKVTYKSHADHVRSLKLHPTDHRAFVTGSDDGYGRHTVMGQGLISGGRTVRQWRVELDSATETIEAHSNDVLAVDIQAGVIVSGGKDRMIKVWSSDTEKVLKTPLGTMQNIAVVRTLWLAQNGREIVAGGGDGAVRVFKCHSTETNKHKVTVQKWNLEWEQKIHQDAISAMVIEESATERLIITASRDKMIKFTKIQK